MYGNRFQSLGDSNDILSDEKSFNLTFTFLGQTDFYFFCLLESLFCQSKTTTWTGQCDQIKVKSIVNLQICQKKRSQKLKEQSWMYNQKGIFWNSTPLRMDSILWSSYWCQQIRRKLSLKTSSSANGNVNQIKVSAPVWCMVESPKC